MSVCPTCYGPLDTGYNCQNCGGSVKTIVYRDGVQLNDDLTPFDEEIIVVCPKCHGVESRRAVVSGQGFFVVSGEPCSMCGGMGRMKAKVTRRAT